MSQVIIYQLLWLVLGVLYNLVSLVMIKTGGVKLAPTDPVVGLAFMSIAAVIIYAGQKGFQRIYGVTILPVIGLLAYSGVYLHLSAFASNSALPGYHSTFSWCLAAGINLIGLAALLKGYRLPE